MLKIKALRIFLLSLTVTIMQLSTTHAALAGMARGTSTGLIDINGDSQIGYIISHKNAQYVPSQEPFDTEIIGVVVENSSISITDPTQTPLRLILQAGEAQIMVSNSNGDIKKGDYITSSKLAGVGQKADKTGFVIGRAMEDFVPASVAASSLIWSTVEPKYAYINNTVKTNLLDALRAGSLSPFLSPIESLRYILAALIVTATFVIGFSTFGKTSGRTIEALGRNPLAQSSIKTAMVFNTVLAFGVMLIGLALAYLILVL